MDIHGGMNKIPPISVSTEGDCMAAMAFYLGV